MQVTSYVFQSPYPSAIQVGRPVAQEQETSNIQNETTLKVNDKTAQDVALYKVQQSSVNVASSLEDSGVVDALNTYTGINSLTQASKAYSS